MSPTRTSAPLLNVHGWELDGTARLFRANILEQGTGDLADHFAFDSVAYDGLNKQEIEAQGGVLNLSYDFGNATLTSITGFETVEMYSRGDIDGGYGAASAPPFGPGFIPFYSESADGLPDHEQFTQEFRLASNNNEVVNWIVGAFYFDESITIDTFNYETLNPDVDQKGYSFQTQDATAYALFGSVDWRVAEDWILKAGIRFSHDEKDFSAERPEGTFQLPTTAPIVRNLEDDFTSWDLSAVYEVNPLVNVYGRVATGFRAPSVQGRILFCADFAGGTDPATNCVTTADTEEILSARSASSPSSPTTACA
jgi:iron complex outermembrane receptor protein